jgi:prepilin-type N-terminal cleavage/methylation domain-containing protein
MMERFKPGKGRQSGITLVEILIAMAIVGLLGAGSASMIVQTFQQNTRSTQATKAIAQVENVAYWVNKDALMTQSIVPAAGSGFPLQLGWQNQTDNVTIATYSISGTNFQRILTIDGVVSQQNVLASQINPDAALTNCSYAEGVLTYHLATTSGTNTQTRTYQTKVRIDQPATFLTIVDPTLPAGRTNVAYTRTMTAVGGTAPYTWTKTAGNLPTGLSFSSAGVFSGTPNVGQIFMAYSFTIQVADSSGLTASVNLTLMINPLTITNTSLPNGKKSKSYGGFVPSSPVYLTASGGTTIYTWSLISGELPTGLSLNASSGLISGTPDFPTAKEDFPITVLVTDSVSQTCSKSLNIHIAP